MILITRILVVLALGPAFLAALFFLPPIALAVIVAFIAGTASFELLRATKAADHSGMYIFTAAAAVLIPLGCGLGWGAGWFVSGLKGDFAPTAGTICTFFLIGLFALLGIIAQWQAMKKKLARRREEKERARAEAEAERLRLELEEAKKERESTGAALEVAAGEPGPEETKPAAETQEEPAAAGAEEK